MKIKILVTVLLAQLSLFAQVDDCNYTISGTVKDEHDKSPLESANIYIPEKGIGATTDSSGAFTIGGLCAGTYVIICSHIGCSPIVDTIELSENMEVNFQPEHHVHELEEISLKIAKNVKYQAQTFEDLSRKDIAKNSGSSLSSTLESISGLTSLGMGANNSKPAIHGLYGKRVLLLNNGVRQEGQQWGLDHSPEIDPMSFQNIVVIKGANTVEYGSDAIGGVIILSPKKLPSHEGVHAELDLMGNSNGRQGLVSGYVEGKFEKLNNFAFRLQGSGQVSGNQSAPSYFLGNTGYRNNAFSGEVGYRKQKSNNSFSSNLFYSNYNSTIGIFSSSHIGNLTDLETALQSNEPIESADFTYQIDEPKQIINHQIVKWDIESNRWKNEFNNRFKFQLSYQKNNRKEFDSHDEGENASLDFTIQTYTGDLSYELKKNFWSIKTGVSAIHQANVYQGRFFIPNFFKQSLGGYSVGGFNTKKFGINLGIRHEQTTQTAYLWEEDQIVEPTFNYNNTSASLNVMYRWTNNIKTVLALGSGWRPPSISEMFADGVHHGTATIEIGNTNLSSETSYNVILNQKIKSHFLDIYADAYFYYFPNYIYLNPNGTALTIRGAFPVFEYMQTAASISGVDLSAIVHLSDQFDLESKGSFLNGLDLSNDDDLNLMPANRVSAGLTWKPKDYKSLTNSEIGITNKIVFKQHKIAQQELVAAPEGYYLLNLRTATSINIHHTPIRVSLEIQNLLNTEYRDYFNRFRYYADDLGQSFILRVSIPIINHHPHESLIIE